MTAFAEEVATLRAVAGEIIDPELHAAIDRLHTLAVEHDDLDARFHAAANEVQALIRRGAAA